MTELQGQSPGNGNPWGSRWGAEPTLGCRVSVSSRQRELDLEAQLDALVVFCR